MTKIINRRQIATTNMVDTKLYGLVVVSGEASNFTPWKQFLLFGIVVGLFVQNLIDLNEKKNQDTQRVIVQKLWGQPNP